MHAEERVHTSEGDRRHRGLPLSECLHAEGAVRRRSGDVPTIPGHDLVPWRWMDYRGQSLRLLWTQIPAGSRRRPRHRELSVIKLDRKKFYQFWQLCLIDGDFLRLFPETRFCNSYSWNFVLRRKKHNFHWYRRDYVANRYNSFYLVNN